MLTTLRSPVKTTAGNVLEPTLSLGPRAMPFDKSRGSRGRPPGGGVQP